MPNHTIVSAAPPTPNGDLHLGHISGPYTGADIFARGQDLLGSAAFYVTGSDIHQSYVPLKARQLGRDVLEMADSYAQEISAIFDRAALRVDAYSLPRTSAYHRSFVTSFVARLHERGRLQARSGDGLYCASCDRYLFEAYVTGGCPHCGRVTDGNSCELCARPNVVTDLTQPRCRMCGRAPTRRTYTQLVFPLEQYRHDIEAFCDSAAMSPQLTALTRSMLQSALPDIPVTHPTDWGIPAPVAGFEEQRIYVWAEMVPGYFAALQQACDARGQGSDWREVWESADQVVQFFGFDNGYFHTVLFPALLRAYDEQLRLPDALITNEFYNLGDEKFSTSRRHAIWAADLLSHLPSDIIRYVLAHDRPETERASFDWDRLHELGDELADTWQPWLTALLSQVGDAHGGRAPAVPAGVLRRHEFAGLLGRLGQDCLHAYSAPAFSPQRAARLLRELVRLARHHAAGERRTLTWRSTSEDATAAMALQLMAAKTLAQLAAPLMPEFAASLWQTLGYSGEPRWDGITPLPAGQPVGLAPTWFKRLPANLAITADDRGGAHAQQR